MVCHAPTASTTCVGSPGSYTGATLTYDNEGRLATWQNAPSSSTTTDSFLYDGEGNRIEQVVQQSGVGETDTVSVGGLEEVTTTTPTGGQPTTSVTAYYGGLALSVNGTLSFLASDNLGSAEEALNTNGQVTASQLYTPYGDSRYSSGTFPTDQAFTGYRADSATGLDYANARYYDPAAGQFVSADNTLQGGLNRYAYVGGNPTSRIDPSGHLDEVDFKESAGGNGTGGGGGGLLGLLCLFGGCEATGGVAADDVMTITSEEGDGITVVSQDDATTGTETDWYEKDGQTGQEVDGQWVAEDDAEQSQEGEAEKNAEEDQAQERNAEANAEKTTEKPTGTTDETCGESFAPTTVVSTPQGKRQIGSLVVGSQVVAYNPKTGKTTTETVQHVFIDHDTDLLDVTLRVTPTRGPPTNGHYSPHRQQGQQAQRAEAQPTTDETVHTTASHPWLTADRGFARAGTLHIGERVVRADGTTATVVGLQVVPGAADMWDLTVSQLHTFAVGAGAYVVHNCGTTGPVNSGNTPAASNGNSFHYDQLNGGTGQGGPSQLQDMYPQTDFDFAPRGRAGPDVTVTGGTPPWDTTQYPNTSWPQDANYGDFKPDTPGGTRTLIGDIYRGKFPVDVVPIWYDPGTNTISGIDW